LQRVEKLSWDMLRLKKSMDLTSFEADADAKKMLVEVRALFQDIMKQARRNNRC